MLVDLSTGTFLLVVKPSLIRAFSALVLAIWLPLCAQAQNIPGVFGPTVDAGDHEFEVRLGLAPDQVGDWTSEARLHYQRALDDRLRLRGVIQVLAVPDSALVLEHVQLELLWQTVERTPDGYESALRFDLRTLREGDRPDRLRLNWIHHWQLSNTWRLRVIDLFAHEVGSVADDGVTLGMRSSLIRRFDSGLQLGLENFSRYGNTDQVLGRFNEQRHSLGPMARGPLVGNWDWYTGVQLGLSDLTDDQAWQFRLVRTF